MQIKGVAVASGGAQLFGRSQRRPMAESFLPKLCLRQITRAAKNLDVCRHHHGFSLLRLHQENPETGAVFEEQEVVNYAQSYDRIMMEIRLFSNEPPHKTLPR